MPPILLANLDALRTSKTHPPRKAAFALLRSGYGTSGWLLESGTRNSVAAFHFTSLPFLLRIFQVVTDAFDLGS